MLDQEIMLNVRINVVNIPVYGMNLFLLSPLHRNFILDRNCSSCKQQLFLVFRFVNLLSHSCKSWSRQLGSGVTVFIKLWNVIYT